MKLSQVHGETTVKGSHYSNDARCMREEFTRWFTNGLIRHFSQYWCKHFLRYRFPSVVFVAFIIQNRVVFVTVNHNSRTGHTPSSFLVLPSIYLLYFRLINFYTFTFSGRYVEARIKGSKGIVGGNTA